MYIERQCSTQQAVTFILLYFITLHNLISTIILTYRVLENFGYSLRRWRR